MTNPETFNLLQQKNFVVSELFLKTIVAEELTYAEIVLLILFDNEVIQELDIPYINKHFNLDHKTIMQAIASLNEKKLLSMQSRVLDGKRADIIVVDAFRGKMINIMLDQTKEKIEKTIFTTFEEELGRPLSPMELELINGWLQNNVAEELIIGALKEAIYNGVKNFRYIDKIIYEWGKKGYKKMSDVEQSNRIKRPDKPQQLFDYNWLEEETKKDE